jgi:hypothetical protein
MIPFKPCAVFLVVQAAFLSALVGNGYGGAPDLKGNFALKGKRLHNTPIVNPPVQSAREGKELFRAPSSLVLGLVVGKEARAYPLAMIFGRTNEVINDTVGGQAVLVTY